MVVEVCERRAASCPPRHVLRVTVSGHPLPDANPSTRRPSPSRSRAYDDQVPSDPIRRRAVYLHIGPPKTGTTYLQSVLWRNRAVLRDRGLTVPGDTPSTHFHAALDLRGIRFGGHDHPEVPGAWGRLVTSIATADTPAVLVSHEVLGGANAVEIARVAADLADHEVHVVCGARDLARQLPAVWQETLKNRRSSRFDSFVTRALRARPDGRPARGFWRAQDLTAMLARWSAAVPAERVHVVTLPPGGAPADTLWRRFCAAVGVDPRGCDLDVGRANVSLNAEDAAVLRRLNELLPADLPWPAYDHLVKRRFRRLAADHHGTGTPVRVPSEHADAVAALAAEIQHGLGAAGYDVVGDLAELTPSPDAYAVEGSIADAKVSEAEVEALAREIVRKARRDPGSRPAAARRLLAQIGRGSSRRR